MTMGEGFINRLPSARDATFIKDGLNELFGRDIGNTRTRHGHLKHAIPGLMKKNRAATGADRRQRSLRHAAWLLTAEIFANAPKDHDPTFRYFLRWLTWLERAVPPQNTIVFVDGVQQHPETNAGDMTAAEAILDTVDQAIDRTKTVRFDWQSASDTDPPLSVAVDRRNRPYTVEVRSKAWDELDSIGYNLPTDSEDDFE
jgi:hypothetical protein